MLRLRTLGSAGLWRGDRPVEGAAVQRRRVALLALLAASGPAGIPRDKVVGYLWPDSDEDRARHSLSQMLFLLRKDGGADDLVLGTADLRLNPERISSDVAEFEEAIGRGDNEGVVELYGGAFLDGFHLGGGSVEFDRWAEGQRDRLARAFGTALEAVAEAAAKKGNLRRCADLWLRLAAIDPYDARVALATVRALDAAGDRAGALAHARVHTTLLREELGTDASPQLYSLLEQIRASPITAPTPRFVRASLNPAPEQGSEQPVDPVAEVAHIASRDRNSGATERPSPPPPAIPWGWRRRAVIAALAVLVVSVSAFQFIPGQMRANAVVLLTRGPATISDRRIVVSPLEDKTGADHLHALGEYVADWVAQELMRTDQFEVVDARTSFGTARVVDEIPRLLRDGDRAIALAEETGAGLLISGRYYQEGDSVIVYMQLTDVANRKLRRSFGPFTGAVSAPSALARTIAGQVVAAAVSDADPSVAAPAVARSAPSSYEGYRHARAAWESYYRGDIDAFFTHAAQAAARDPEYMAPLAMQAHVRAEMRDWARVDSLTRIMQPREGRLSEIELAALQLSRAQVNGDLPGQLEGAQAVVRATPASRETRTFAARVAVNMNRPRLALAALEGLDPRRGVLLAWPWYWNWKTAALHQLGQHAEELAEARQGLRQFPDHRATRLAMLNVGRAFAALGRGDEVRRLAARIPSDGPPFSREKIVLDLSRELRAHGDARAADELLSLVLAELSILDDHALPRAWALRGAAELEAGRIDDARRSAEQLIRVDSSSIAGIGLMGVVAARRGDSEGARRSSERLALLSQYATGRNTIWRARIAAASGDRDSAIRLARGALAQGYSRFFDPGGGPFDEPDLHIDPAFASIRAHPEFARLVEPARD
jgi:DNA-binding SARP family transcriptional activator/TolB-like protein/tetratricopeptide (TPR) repeat protein